MANYMAEVAKMLGVEMNKNFRCDYVNGVFCITDEKLTYNGVYSSDMLMMLLNGQLAIKHKPWKPQYGEYYYYVSRNNYVLRAQWYDDIIDVLMYKLGNCYCTKEQAEANRDKWVAFYASDDVLEV
jgi:hypothetical protein